MYVKEYDGKECLNDGFYKNKGTKKYVGVAAEMQLPF